VVGAVFRKTLVALMEHGPTSYSAFQKLREMPQEDIDNFLAAYDILENLGADDRHGVKTPAEVKAIHDYYKVLHQILAVGVVMEIMLLPPSLDPDAGVLKNIELFVERMISFLDLKPGQRVLDNGSGRGKIAQIVHAATGASVIQINLDETQIEFSKGLAQKAGTTEFMEWHHMDYNLPYTFLADGSVDASFCAQSCAFQANKTRFLKEVYRVLKPGGRIYNLEWLTKDKSENKSTVARYDPKDKTHRELVQKTGTLVGGSFPSGIAEWEAAFHEAGLELIASREPSPVNCVHEFRKTDDTYRPVTNFLVRLADFGIVPKRFKELFLRLRIYVESAIKAHEMEICSLTYEFVARKPL